MSSKQPNDVAAPAGFRFGDPSSLLEDVQTVASLPTIYTRVIELLADPHAGTPELAALIEKDPALTARILRLANSAFYSNSNNVESVTQAIMTIGTQQMRDVVLASSITSAFDHISIDLIDMDAFWRHSVACGIVARLIAGLRGNSNAETAFVSGLLHDLGRLVLFQKLASEMAQLMQKSREQQIPLYQLEREAFGFDHAMLGGDLLEQWQLPSVMVDTTLHHHDSTRSNKYPIDACAIQVANQLSKSLITGHSGDANIEMISAEQWATLELKREDVDLLKDEFERQYAVAIDFVLD